MSQPKVILASSSVFRRELLARLNIEFSAISPEIDETPAANESAIDLVQRLAEQKALRIAQDQPDAVVIGSDQVADLNGQIIGKPGSRDQAIAQLRAQSGQTIYFHTGLSVVAPTLAAPLTTLETVTTIFRTLTVEEIERYVDQEDVTATAGSIKSEGLGISLLESIQSADPTTLIGLPVIKTCQLLRQAGLTIP